MDYRKRPSILEANLFFLFLAMLLLFLGSIVQAREIYTGLLITEYILVLLPNLLFLRLRGMSLRKNLSLNKISLKNIILVILITLFAYPLVVFIQAIFLGLISMIKNFHPAELPIPTGDIEYLYSFFVIAISPGICEEVMFRGTIMSAYNKLGPRKSIVISAMLFAIFHFTILNFIGPLLLGIIFGIMVEKTKSIYSSIIGHTVNNGIALTILYFFNKYGEQIDQIGQEVGSGETMAMGKGILFILFFLLLSAYIVFKLLKSLSSDEDYDLYISHGQYEDYSIDYHDGQVGFVLNYLPILISIIIFFYINWKFILI